MHTTELPSGYDLRDALRENPIEQLTRLLGAVVEVPAEWRGQTRVCKSISPDLIDCRNYHELVNAWRRAMKWTDGLDAALGVMLASSASTQLIGEQLWCKIISPPSCLNGDTPIYDPIGKDTLTVRDRWLQGRSFHVWSLRQDGTTCISCAKPPYQYPKASIYEVVLSSGKKLLVTSGHRIWNGSSYVAVGTISDALLSSASYHLPSISEPCLSAQKLNDLYLRKTTPSSRFDYCSGSCLCDGLLHQGLSSGLDAFPSPAGARQRSQTELLLGDSVSSDRYTDRPLCARRSTYNDLARSELAVDASLPRLCGGTSLLSPESFQALWNTRLCLRLTGIDRLPSEFGCRSKDYGGTTPPPHKVPDLREIDRREVSWLSQPGLVRTDTERRKGRSSSGTTPSYRRVWESPRQSEGTSSTKGKGKPETSILPNTDEVVSVRPIKVDHYYDFEVPGTNNYWACGLFHHNTGKTTIGEGLGLDKAHTVCKDSIRGFYSGWKDGEGEDRSLAAQCKGKTLIIKDGDTLLKAPNLQQILSEGRGLYDRVGRTHYRNAVTQDYEGHRMTVLLCGTASLREIDESELGCRFLDCVIMDSINDDFEDEVLWRVVNQESTHMLAESDGKLESQYPPELMRAMKMTGGYLHYLRTNVVDLLSSTAIGEGELARCGKLGKFVAYLRARPHSIRLDAEPTREFSARLAKQLVRLARILAVVLNRPRVDTEVMRRVRKVSMDTARGLTLNIVSYLFHYREGLEPKSLALYTNQREQDIPKFLRFLRGIGVVESFRPEGPKGGKGRTKYRLTDRMYGLYSEIVDEQGVVVRNA